MSLADFLVEQTRPSVHLTHAGGPGSLCGFAGGEGAKDTRPPSNGSLIWHHVLSLDATRIPREPTLTGTISLFAEFDEAPDQTEYFKDDSNGLITSKECLNSLVPKADRKNYRLLPPSKDAFGNTDRYHAAYEPHGDFSNITTGEPLFGVTSPSPPPMVAIPEKILDDASDSDFDAYENRLFNLPIHCNSEIVAVLGGWRHTPRDQDEHAEIGTLLLSMFKHTDGHLEIWLQEDGSLVVERVTV
jgi:hypothetical protein